MDSRSQVNTSAVAKGLKVVPPGRSKFNEVQRLSGITHAEHVDPGFDLVMPFKALD